MGESNSAAKEIDLGNGFGDIAVTANGSRVEIHADGSVDAYTGGAVKAHPAATNDGSPFASEVSPARGSPSDGSCSENSRLLINASHEIGVVECDGEHQGKIYGGIWFEEYDGDNKPIWFSTAPSLMDHYAAATWAKEQGGSLPTKKQGDFLAGLRGKGGGFRELFNRGSSFFERYVWLAKPLIPLGNYAWCQRLSDGDQTSHHRNVQLSVVCVFR